MMPKRISLLVFLSVMYLGSSAQINADFSANITEGCAPLVVTFNNNSSATGNTAWLWNFGNGNTSDLKNPAAIFSAPGIYTVTLIATDTVTGAADTFTRVGYIITYALPLPGFSADVRQGCVPLTVNFSDLSVPTSASIAEWYWDFGDGNKSSVRNPAHTYNTAGVYTVYLIVKDGIGCQNIFFIDSYITATRPFAAFSAPNTLCSDFPTFTFNNTSSGNDLTYSWDFGDGSNSTQENPAHTFSTAQDKYPVQLVATDTLGCVDTFVKEISLLKADFGYSVNCKDDFDDSTFTVSFFDSTGASANKRMWSFGDNGISISTNPIHQYDSIRPYTVTLIAGDSTGCMDTVVRTYVPPKADFSVDTPWSCKALQTVTFTNLSLGTDSLSFFWDLGDGTISTDTNPVHTYNVPKGIYQAYFKVFLVTSNKFGCTDTFKSVITIEKPKADFKACPDADGFPPCNDKLFYEGCAPLTVSPFYDKSEPEDSIVGWNWDFGEGGSSSVQNPAHTFTDTGRYTITLIATNNRGCKDTMTKVNYVHVGIKPDYIDFDLIPGDIVDTYPHDTVCGHRTHVFIPYAGFLDTSIKITNWCWTFCSDWFTDDSCYDEPGLDEPESHHSIWDTTVHHYNKGLEDEPPCYHMDSVRLIAGHNGCNDTLIKPVLYLTQHYSRARRFDYLDNGTPTCRSDFLCSSPLPVKFYIAHNMCWEFFHYYYSADYITGDTVFWLNNEYDTAYYTYTKAGVYSLNIKIEDTATLGGTFFDCPDASTKFFVIDSVLPGFTTTPNPTCLSNRAVTFEDTTFCFFGEVTRWKWLFGDGDTLASFGEPTQIHTFCYNDEHVEQHCITDISTDSVYTICFRHDTVFCVGNNCQEITCPDSTTCMDTVIIYIYDYNGTDTIRSLDSIATGTYLNPTHIYDDTGTYIVKLEVTTLNDPYNPDIDKKIVLNLSECTHIVYDTIRVEGTKIGFTADKRVACLGDIISFSDTSATTTSITKWQWYFGDGQNSTVQNPAHIYPDTGTYTLSLAVEDALGCKDTLVRKQYIHVSFPNANFACPDSLCTGDSIPFINYSSGEKVSFVWDFGDGSPPDFRYHPNHLFSPGDYTIRLTVSDSNNCVDTMTKPVFVIDKPAADFTADTFKADCYPLIVLFSNLSSGDNIVSYLWDFGDGQVSASMNPTHIYTQNGKFDVRLITTNSIGCTDTVVNPAFISIDGPAGTFTLLEDTVCYPDSVIFIANTQNAAYYVWDFGDGTLNAMSPADKKDTVAHLYQLSGSFIPSLLLYNDKQQCPYLVSAAQNIVLQKIQPDYLSDKDFLCALDSVLFTDSSTSLLPIKNYHWNFGDGDSLTTTTQQLKHYFDTSGIYKVTLTVTDSFGCTAIISRNIIVNESPQIAFSKPDTAGCAPFSVQFIASTQAPFLMDSDFVWDLGDGNSATGDTVSYVYQGNGIFDVNLQINFAQGKCLVDSAFSVEAVAVPQAEFEIFPLGDNCLSNSRFYFRNNTQNAVSYLWQFGNDSSSLSENPDYLYPDSGTYSVKIIAYNKLGCADSAMLGLLAYDNSVLFTAPNVFTPFPTSPNQNDVFEIPGLPDNSSIKIYNRWGEKVFEENPYRNKWDGRDMRTSQPLEAGVYYYILSFCEEKTITGYVHLLREE